MIKNITILVLLSGPAVPAIYDVNNKNNKEYVEIILEDEDEFHPYSGGLNETKKEIDAIIADNDSKYNDGSERWTSYYDEKNGIFEFTLPDEFKEITIDQKIKVSGLYDEYYSYIGVLVPVGADTLAKSQEIFQLRGTVKNDGSEIKVGSGEVTYILDTWGSDNYGKTNVDWYMSLNTTGNILTLRVEGYETGDIWAYGTPIWMISEITEANENDKEYHNKIGNGAPYMHHYNFDTPEQYSNNILHLKGIIK